MRWVFFDLDGTLADSIPTMVDLYHGFLARHGKQGTQAEFDSLNGPPVEECMPVLRRNHDLAPSVSELIAEYRALVDERYAAVVRPMPDAGDVLSVLTERGHRLMLVTGGQRSSAEAFLARQGWSRLFRGAVCGNEVRPGKPAPEIYLKAMERAGLARPHCVVVEDSPNGVRAARRAGAYVVGLSGHDTSDRLRLSGADRVITGLRQLLDLDGPLSGRPEFVARGPVEVRGVRDDWRPRKDEEVSRIFEGHPKVVAGDVFDAPTLDFRGIDTSGSRTVVRGSFVGYRYYFVQREVLRLQQGVRPVGVSGMTRLEESGRRFVLVARRSPSVTAYRGRLELVPSGSLDDEVQRPDGTIDVEAKLREEFEEETGLGRDRIASIETCGLVFDPTDICYDVCARILLRGERRELESELRSEEYGDFTWVPVEELPEFVAEHGDELVPTSRCLLETLR